VYLRICKVTKGSLTSRTKSLRTLEPGELEKRENGKWWVTKEIEMEAL